MENHTPSWTFIKLLFRPNIQHLVYLAGKTEADRAAGASSIEGLALATVFFTQTIGSDVIGGKWNAVDESRLVDFYAQWSSENRIATGMADELLSDVAAEARARWDALKDNLDVTLTRGHSNSEQRAYRVDPIDPVELLAECFLTAWRSRRRSSTSTSSSAGPLRPWGRISSCHALQPPDQSGLGPGRDDQRRPVGHIGRSALRQAVDSEPTISE